MPYINGSLRSAYDGTGKADLTSKKVVRRIMSENQLIQCRKHFWRDKPTKRVGKLSLGEFMKMCSDLDFQLSREAVNRVFQITDQNGCITSVEFLNIYFQNHMEMEADPKREPVRELSPAKVSHVRKSFFDRERKRYGKMSRVELMEMIHTGGIVMTVDDLSAAFELAECAVDGKVVFEEFICLFLKGVKGGDRRMAELEIISRCFSTADTDGNGKLDRSEFRHLLKSIGLDVDARQFSHFFRLADTDRGGSISFEEFREVSMKSSKFSMKSNDELPTTERIRLSHLPTQHLIKIRQHFALYDHNRDGRLSWDEFCSMVNRSNISDVRLRKARTLLRTSKNNTLSFQQFINLFANVQELSACFGLDIPPTPTPTPTVTAAP